MKGQPFDFDPVRRFLGVVLQQGRVQLDADSGDDDESVHASPDWTGKGVHDPGITLVELLAYAADQLSAYADQVAAEARTRTRRRRSTVAAGAGILLLTWWCRWSRTRTI